MTSTHVSAATWTSSAARYSWKRAYRLDLTDCLLVVVIRGRQLTEYVIGFHVWQQDLNTFRSPLPLVRAELEQMEPLFLDKLFTLRLVETGHELAEICVLA
jgi:hypothetical protein